MAKHSKNNNLLVKTCKDKKKTNKRNEREFRMQDNTALRENNVNANKTLKRKQNNLAKITYKNCNQKNILLLNVLNLKQS